MHLLHTLLLKWPCLWPLLSLPTPVSRPHLSNPHKQGTQHTPAASSWNTLLPK